MRKDILIVGTILLIGMSCNTSSEKKDTSTKTVRLVTLDPGHFHAALVQKSMYDDVDSNVYVYAPAGTDLQLHLDRITAYNNRKDDPTHWKENVYSGNDFFEKMLLERKGNVVVLAGNNKNKTDYILHSLQNGFNVLGDKPMAIDSSGFEELKQAFDVAAKDSLVLYDIMTERFEITSILMRELSMIPEVFGELQKGTEKDPAVVKTSTHYLYKYVSGSVLTRPDWFMDVSQQGEGIADVMTHLVDLAQWECFPDQSLDYLKDIQVNSAKHWTTDLGLSQFKEITKLDNFPSFLKANVVKDTLLKTYFNGEVNYTLKGVHVKATTKWDYKSANNSGDLYEAIMKGTKANLIIKQGAAENYKPVLYIEPTTKDVNYEAALIEKIKTIQSEFPGVELKKTNKGWEVVIPDNYKEGHEEHFGRVTKNFLEYLKNKNMPAWEVPNMLAKYYTTTKALAIAKSK